MTEEKLKPCPFCGGGKVEVFGPVGWYREYGITHSCRLFYNGSSRLAEGFHSRKDAIEAWNTRACLPTSEIEATAREREAAAAGEMRAAVKKWLRDEQHGDVAAGEITDAAELIAFLIDTIPPLPTPGALERVRKEGIAEGMEQAAAYLESCAVDEPGDTARVWAAEIRKAIKARGEGGGA